MVKSHLAENTPRRHQHIIKDENNMPIPSPADRLVDFNSTPKGTAKMPSARHAAGMENF